MTGGKIKVLYNVEYIHILNEDYAGLMYLSPPAAGIPVRAKANLSCCRE